MNRGGSMGDNSAENTNSKTFIRITNRDIYDMIAKIDKKIDDLISDNNYQHSSIIQRQDKTNGNVKLNKWIATTALTLVMTIAFYLISAALK